MFKQIQLEEFRLLSINFNIKSTQKKIVLDITMLDYCGAVDGGRKAGKQPPIDKIKEWLSYPNVRDKIRFGQNDSAFTEPISIDTLSTIRPIPSGTPKLYTSSE